MVNEELTQLMCYLVDEKANMNYYFPNQMWNLEIDWSFKSVWWIEFIYTSGKFWNIQWMDRRVKDERMIQIDLFSCDLSLARGWDHYWFTMASKSNCISITLNSCYVRICYPFFLFFSSLCFVSLLFSFSFRILLQTELTQCTLLVACESAVCEFIM